MNDKFSHEYGFELLCTNLLASVPKISYNKQISPISQIINSPLSASQALIEYHVFFPRWRMSIISLFLLAGFLITY